MNHPDLESRLKELRRAQAEPIPSIVDAKMNEAFRMLPKLDRTRRRRRIYALGAVSASVMLGAAMLVSVFVSPAMASKLREIPIIENLFELTNNMGLKTADEAGLTTDINQSVTKNGVTVSISKLVYTGSNISFILHQQAEDQNHKRNFSVGALVNGQPGPFSFSTQGMRNGGQAGVGAAAIIKLSHAEIDSRTGLPYRFPDQFELTLKIGLEGMGWENYEFKIDVARNDKLSTILEFDQTVEAGNLRYTVERLELTPLMTKLVVNVEQYGEMVERLKENEVLDFVLFDQDGRPLEPNGWHGRRIMNTGATKLDIDFDPFVEKPDNVIVKPRIWSYERRQPAQERYIEGAEIELPVK
ncbi:DUF4179 domain-containing protein [Paenibacillus xanthanilyticus]|uniref:DUF4179 domain-containing protein n=1 Tax=Paenibacillus xanthanilyticus TaxID=1783531 RepID=A0ABV8K1E9_9BACL